MLAFVGTYFGPVLVGDDIRAGTGGLIRIKS